MSMKHSESDLLDHLRELADELGRVPRYSDMEEHGDHSPTTYASRFGSYTDARKIAGVDGDTRSGCQSTPDDDLLDALRDLAEEKGRQPTTKEMAEEGEYDPNTYYRHFDSWQNAKEKIGFDGSYVMPQNRIPEEDLLEEIFRLADGDSPPTQDEMRRRGEYSTPTYQERFGSWNEALRTAGYSVNKRAQIGKEDLLIELRGVANELDKPPTVFEMEEFGDYYWSQYIREFGSWNDALRAVGFDPNQRKDVLDQELLSDLYSLGEDLGHPPSTREVNQLGKFHSFTYRKRWGSIWEARKAAGFDEEEPADVTEEALLTDLERMVDDLGRAPSYGELTEHSEFSGSSYEKVFGTWHNALEEGGVEPVPTTGEHHPNWRGGYDGYYGPNWPEQRRAARARDDYHCQACGVDEVTHRENTGERLSVHHITPFREFTDGEADYESANALDNLVTLCKRCHVRWEGIPLRPDAIQ